MEGCVEVDLAVGKNEGLGELFREEEGDGLVVKFLEVLGILY